MKNRLFQLFALILGTALVLEGCIVSAGGPTSSQVGLMTTQPPPPIPSDPPLSETPVLGPTITGQIEEPLPTALTTPIDISSCTPDAQFVEDITIPDDTVMQPGEAFTKTWRVLNNGSCDWGEGFSLVFVSGTQMSGASPSAVPSVLAGSTADLSINLVAPAQPGRYIGLWQLQAPDGVSFGSDVYLEIIVAGDQTPTSRVQENLTSTPVSGSPSTGTVVAANCINDSVFLLDVTIPDNTVIQSGTTFTKTWRIRNTGTCGWDANYQLKRIGGTQMAASDMVPVPATLAGGTADITVSMTAPSKAGTYTSLWQMVSPQGDLFGSQPYVQIVVQTTDVPPSSGYQPAPYISNVTARAREIYLHGQQLGNRANVFSKIGDSLTDESWFLYAVGEGRANLQSYTNLQDVVNFFLSGNARTSNSFNNESIAAAGGWDSFDLLDPANSSPYDFCGGMNPVECEIRTVKPSVAIILIGSNDGEWNVSNGEYGRNLRRIAQLCIDNGTIPVLTTVPWSVYRVNPQMYNDVIWTVAAEYQIPVIDYSTPMYQLPNHGVRDDGVHPSIPPDQNPASLSTENLMYGYTLRNLLTLQMLDALYHTVLY